MVKYNVNVMLLLLNVCWIVFIRLMKVESSDPNKQDELFNTSRRRVIFRELFIEKQQMTLNILMVLVLKKYIRVSRNSQKHLHRFLANFRCPECNIKTKRACVLVT